MDDLQQQINDLKDLFFKHKHTQIDKSQKLPSSGSFATGSATVVSGSVTVTDSSCKSTSKIFVVYSSGMTSVGVFQTAAATGSFTIYVLDITTAGIKAAADGTVNYVILY